MIHSVRANDSRFKTVRLRAGLNVLLADTTTDSTAQDTRNGVGKTLLLEVVHFCLGGRAPQLGGLADPALTGWAFTLEMDVQGRRVAVTRSLGMPQSVALVGSFDEWSIAPTWDAEQNAFVLAIDDWRSVLGAEMFGLNALDGRYAYSPSFRLLYPYFARVHSGAYETPFKFFSRQREWQRQVCMAFLLDLDWTKASRYQELKDQRAALASLKRALEQGALGDPTQTVGQLRTQRVRLSSQIGRLNEQLDNFEVHPEYRAIAAEANELTRRVHEIVNRRVITERKVAMYEQQFDTEAAPDTDAVVSLFARAGIELSDNVQRTLAEAEEFHNRVIANRRAYLRDEMELLRHQDEEAGAEVESLSARRAHLLEILETKHALDELNQLNERLAEYRAELADVDSRIARVTEIRERQASLEINGQQLARDAQRELAERESQWRDAIELFAANTEALYGAPGELIIDLNDNGFVFDVNIDRSGSHGVNNMKIFAFDLMLAQRWAAKPQGPSMLWHDSELFDGVDERQVGAALQLAAREAEDRGFQYFCSLNSDDLPPADYLGDLEVTPVLTLTDASDEGGLFGMRF